MIKCHPMIQDKDFDRLIAIEIQNAGLTGYVSKNTLKELFNLFSWVYVEGKTAGAFSEDSKIKRFLDMFDLSKFKGESLCYSAVLFYGRLSRVINIRNFELGEIKQKKEGDNKLLSKESFNYEGLYDMYATNSGDLTTDFLLFNDLFKETEIKEVIKIRNYGDITKLMDVTAALRPDFSYKLATKQLDISLTDVKRSTKQKKIYILQDCTMSIRQYLHHIQTIKAFILNEAFRHNYEVEWLYINDKIEDRETYTISNMKGRGISYILCGNIVDTSKILTLPEFVGKQVVIITDGTDSFNFPFNTSTKKISVVSFLDNIKIKNKISNYGRFFKVTL